jgi:hypothetical protein
VSNQDPEIRAAGEARWAEISSPPLHPAAIEMVTKVRELQEIFAAKKHILASTQIWSDWVHLHCERCVHQWGAFVHGIELGFFRGLDECKGGAK